MNEWDDIEKRIAEDSEKLEMNFQEDFWNDMEVLLDKSELGATSKVEEPFREEYWDEMLVLLEEDSKKKRRALWWRWAFDAVAILVLTLTMIKPATFVSDESTSRTAQSKVHQHTEKSANVKEAQSNNLKAFPNDQTGTVSIENPVFEENVIASTLSINSHDIKLNEAKNKGALPKEQEERSIENLPISDLSESVNNLEPFSWLALTSSNPLDVRKSDLETTYGNKRRSIFRPLSLNLLVASNAALAPRGNVTNNSPIGTNSSIGLELTKYRPNWSFSIGGNYTFKTGLNHELNLVRSTYGAQLYREYQSVSYKSIGSIGVPVGVNYHGKRNVFGMRVTPMWNLMVNSTYHRYTNYNSDELLVENNFGIKEGIRPFDLRIQFLYQRRITEKLAVGLNVSGGLFNQIDPTIITNSDGLRELSMGFNINYTLLSH